MEDGGRGLKRVCIRLHGQCSTLFALNRRSSADNISVKYPSYGYLFLWFSMCKCDRMATLNKSLAFHRANMERQAILHTYNLDSCLCTEGLIQSEHSGKHTFPHSIRCKEWYYFCICSKYEATGRLAWLSLSSVGFRDLAFIPSMVEMLKTCPVFSVTAEAWHACQ